jgi:hypothetical protein
MAAHNDNGSDADAGVTLFVEVLRYSDAFDETPDVGTYIPIARRVVALIGKSDVSDEDACEWCETLLGAYRERGLIDFAESLTRPVH